MAIFESQYDIFGLVEILGYEMGVNPDGTLGVWPGRDCVEKTTVQRTKKENYIEANPGSVLAEVGPNCISGEKLPYRPKPPKNAWGGQYEVTLENRECLLEAIAMRRAGARIKDIAEKFKVSKTYIFYVLQGSKAPHLLVKCP